MSNLQNPPALNSISPFGFWDGAVGALSRELSPQQFKTWIQPLVLLSFDEGDRLLTIGAPNRFKLDWIKKTFAERFQEMAADYFGGPINVHFALAVEGAAPTKPNGADEVSNPPVSVEVQTNTTPSVSIEEQSFEIEDHSKLNPNLTFETFVTGKANQLARAASIQVAHNCGIATMDPPKI
ncbi:hypothetical protein DCO17_00005 [Polynucleobacter tropicus]|uniref:Chromosomal replication initiator protein DnaA n=1 Tax=Polynucleobacter tropicus TaxID=1743174 RepID=A0A6M9Q1K5_9BURK|nr:DnaA N-terminal domain-containing protein [Polynucleobacter tropicus]QKM65608.1 hypothetical protein DCO17_00005 [Polynucleobacter tropicus]